MLLLLTDRLVVDTLVALSVATVIVPVRVGEALGAKRLVISVLLIRSEGEFSATGDESTPLKAY